jgi:antitoxin VapB
MALHIRQERTEKLARELAKRTGETLTGAVHKALEERLGRVAKTNRLSEDAQVAELMTIAERATGLQAEGKTARQLIDELYDENGLPR